MYVPTDRAMLEGFDRALWSCLQHLPQRQKKHVLEELGRITGREIDMDEDNKDIDIDGLWVYRHEQIITRGVRALADRCPKLRKCRLYVDSHWHETSLAYTIRRVDGGSRCKAFLQASWPDCLSGETAPFLTLVGKELRAAKQAWLRDRDRWSF